MNKKDYQEMFKSLIAPLRDKYSKGGALLPLGGSMAGYGAHIAAMEGFSRVLWGLAPYLCGGGEAEDWAERYRRGLAVGTNPDSEEYWGDLGDRDQRMVEMASISYSILLIPQYFWEPFSAEEKRRLANWLKQINYYKMPENNWQYFDVLVNLALKSVGEEYDEDRMREAMELYESFYLGNGWYSDGRRPQKDYYISFAIHYYCLLYAKFEWNTDGERERCILFKERAKEFAKDFIYWFDDEGRGLLFGRSLTYRFAQSAFFSACLLADVECLPLGVIKGIIERNLKYWLGQPIFDNGGVLTIGCAYPNLIMSEGYNSPGSPYWALKSFAFLALEDSHPFWEAEAEPLLPLDNVHLIKEADMLMQRLGKETVALTSGQYSVVWHTHTAEKYSKFAYSSYRGFSVPRSYCTLQETAPDSMLVFEINGMFWVRRRCDEFQVTETEVLSKWSPFPGITVRTTLIPTDNGHKRHHVITSELECRAYDCGFSCPYEPVGKNKTVFIEKEGAAEVSGIKDYEKITADRGQGRVIAAAPNTNLVFPLSCIPAIEIAVHAGITELNSEITIKIK